MSAHLERVSADALYQNSLPEHLQMWLCPVVLRLLIIAAASARLGKRTSKDTASGQFSALQRQWPRSKYIHGVQAVHSATLCMWHL